MQESIILVIFGCPVLNQSKQLERTFALIDGLEVSRIDTLDKRNDHWNIFPLNKKKKEIVANLDSEIDQYEQRIAQIEDQQNWATSQKLRETAFKVISSFPGTGGMVKKELAKKIHLLSKMIFFLWIEKIGCSSRI